MAQADFDTNQDLRPVTTQRSAVFIPVGTAGSPGRSQSSEQNRYELIPPNGHAGGDGKVLGAARTTFPEHSIKDNHTGKLSAPNMGVFVDDIFVGRWILPLKRTDSTTRRWYFLLATKKEAVWIYQEKDLQGFTVRGPSGKIAKYWDIKDVSGRGFPEPLEADKALALSMYETTTIGKAWTKPEPDSQLLVPSSIKKSLRSADAEKGGNLLKKSKSDGVAGPGKREAAPGGEGICTREGERGKGNESESEKDEDDGKTAKRSKKARASKKVKKVNNNRVRKPATVRAKAAPKRKQPARKSARKTDTPADKRPKKESSGISAALPGASSFGHQSADELPSQVNQLFELLTDRLLNGYCSFPSQPCNPNECCHRMS